MHSVFFLKTSVGFFCGEWEKVSLTSLCVNFLIGSFCSFIANAKIMLYIELRKPLSDLHYSLSTGPGFIFDGNKGSRSSGPNPWTSALRVDMEGWKKKRPRTSSDSRWQNLSCVMPVFPFELLKPRL